MKRNKRFFGMVSVLLCAVVLISICAACGNSGRPAPNAATERKSAAQDGGRTTLTAGMADAAAATSSGAGNAGEKANIGTAATAALTNQKIIERLSYRIETLKFDDSVKTIQSLCNELGGYVQDSSMDGKGIQGYGNMRGANYVLRIPQGKLNQFKNSAGDIGSVLNFTSSSENVSEKYFDKEARLKSLSTQQERLLTLLTKSGSLTDVIALEKALADVNYQIEQLTGTLRGYDSLINFSTVSIELHEVVKPTELENIPVTLGDKIAQQFKESMRSLSRFGEGLLVFFVGGAPIILLLAAIVAVVIIIVRRKRKRTEKENKERMALINSATQKPEKDEERPEK